VVLKVKDHDVSFNIGKSQDEFTLGFNFKYLQLLGNNKTLMFNNELSPVVVKDGNSTNVVMPLKL
jgi:DNA polymerase III sliding clamp (beta) subunit (PCNA family)